jgi:hypothetical protein
MADELMTSGDRARASLVRAAPVALGLAAAGLWWVSGWATLGAGILALHALLARAALGGMPEKLDLRERELDSLPGEIVEKVRDLEALGFSRGGPLVADMGAMDVPLVPLFHPEQPCFGVVYSLPTGPALDIVSERKDASASLTTATSLDAANAAVPLGRFRQVLPGASAAACWDRHRESLAWLAQQGVELDPLSPGEFNHALRRSVRDQRRAFLRAPWRHTAIALWRMTTKRSPFLEPLQQQRAVRRALARLGKAAR